MLLRSGHVLVGILLYGCRERIVELARFVRFCTVTSGDRKSSDGVDVGDGSVRIGDKVNVGVAVNLAGALAIGCQVGLGDG